MEGNIPPLLMGRYELGKLLGRGSFAKVHHARNVETGEEVAIKIMDKDHLARSGAAQRQVMREIDIMRRVRHPHVVRIHEVMATRRSIFVVMEFVGGGSLDAYLVHRAGRGVGEAPARRVFQQLVSALDYCHSLGVYHRDIKPDNILVDAGGTLCDFGCASPVRPLSYPEQLMGIRHVGARMRHGRDLHWHAVCAGRLPRKTSDPTPERI